MAQRDILSRLGVKEPQSLTLAAAGSASADAIDSQGFGRGIMFAINAVATISVTSITEDGAGTATVTIADTSGLTVGDAFVISGADQADYNIAGTIIAIPLATTFTYAVANTPVDATGTLLMTVTGQVAIAASVAVGSYSMTHSADNVTFAAVPAKAVLPTRKQAGGNLLVDTTIDANDSQIWQQGFGVFSNERYVIPTITLASIATGVSITWSLTPILAADRTPFDTWDGTLTGDSVG